MAFAEHINRPVTIQGKQVVLMPDMVGPVPLTEQHEYAELTGATTRVPDIHVREADIEALREQHPGVPIYGMWDTLITSGVVSFNAPLQIVSQNVLDGHYIACQHGRIQYSGIYEAGFFAADADFNLDEARVIDPEPAALKLPAQQAKLAVEMQLEKRRQVQSAWFNLGILIVALILAGVVTDFMLMQINVYRYETLKSKAELLEHAQSGLEKLKTTRLTSVPDDSETLEKIAVLWTLDHKLRTQEKQSFAKKSFDFLLTDKGSDPALKASWLQTRYHPAGEWSASFAIRK